VSLKLSIITVTYNSADTLEETILSVINQSYTNIEYIIIDGQSTDDTLKIVEKYKHKIAKVISEKDKGLYDALNKGIEQATGDVIGFIHSDDFYPKPNILEKYAETFLRTGCDAVYADLYYVDKKDTEKIIRTWKSGNYKKGSFINGWMPPHPTFFVKRRIYSQLGQFNLAFKTAADYELMLRFIHKNNIALAYLPEFTVKMRVGGKSNITLQSRLNANLEDRQAWEMNGIKPKFYTLYLKPLRKLTQFFTR
jgi:glycosyltransferase involved in cell wall biosynthesis